MAKKITKIEPVSVQVALQLQPKKRVCAYCRVSTDSREQQNSFSAQVKYYTGLIGKKDDWEYAGIYADEARSGTKLQKRDEFLRMMKDCEAGKVDMIITKSVTRFARNTVDSIQAIRKLKALSIAVYFEKEHINTLSEKSEQMLTILSSLAQGESEGISTNTKWAVKKRFQDGSFIIGCPAYGYTKDEAGELIIKDEEAVVVCRIFKEYLNGKGSYVIAKGLSEDGIPTIRSAEKWQDSVVKEILQNPIYTGDLLLQKTFTTEVVPFKRKSNKGQLPQYFISENHEPIITKEQFEAVKEIYEYRRKQMGIDDSGKYQNRYIFSSNIICGECGSTFRRQKIYIGKPYEKIQWCCSQHIEDKSKCSVKGIREDVIKRAFTVMWNKLTSNYTDILIVLYNPSTGECIWENVNKQTAQKCQNGWKIKLPCRQSLECSKQELEQLANKQSEYERRLSALVLAKEWMLATEERGEIILEVEEWINKTSGRGKFELKTEDKNGTEKILFQREIFGFGTKDYEIVFHELFPWADINIDEEFYEENMEEKFCQSRCISDRELAAIFGKVGSDLLQYNDEPRKLYPYRNGAGEVDFYRLKLTLNQIGKSFLDLDSFLETGKCYFLDNGIL